MPGKVPVKLATGLEDHERVTVAFLVATAALDQGREVVIWTTQRDDRGRDAAPRMGGRRGASLSY